ncbi:hypothetical protein JKP88DRAFT_348677 [Tribonema minus]|uniref:AI-2E family transporter n=1 Tax=Tribonema minus TaxID=303371 RepID=A0A835Z5M1_9STRA|nr:hypothetical protein JKP88DRAFT_348677 [Tribonema minus]
MGFMLYFLRTILVPFFIAIFFMHLLQPVVNLLSRPPRRWCNKCTKRNGELCCEGMNTLTRSRRYSDISDGGTAHVTPAPAVLSGGATGFRPDVARHLRHRPHQLSVDLDDEALAPPPALTCMDYPIIPRWLAVIMALVLAVSLVIVLGVIVYTSVMNLETQFYRYEEGASNLAKLLKKYMALVDYSLDEDVVPWLFKTMRDLTPRVLAMVLSSVAYMIYVVIFLTFLLISPTRPIPSSAWGAIDLHIRRYIRLKTSICVSVGISTGAILWALNIQLSWVFGLVAFVLNFLPNIGPMVATCLPMPLVLLDPDLSAVNKVLAFALPTLIHLMVGNVVEPKIFGEHFSLSPVVVLLNITFWSLLWGLPGAILSVPLLVCVRITCLHLEHPYARTAVALMEGRIFEAHLDALAGGRKASWAGDAGFFEGGDRRSSATYQYDPDPA